MPDELLKLQKWYAAQCNGEWEHRYGITISTSDNPAWNVGIDLAGTTLEGAILPQYTEDNGDDDWFMCNIIDNKFNAVGDPSKLVVILNQFFQLVPKS